MSIDIATQPENQASASVSNEPADKKIIIDQTAVKDAVSCDDDAKTPHEPEVNAAHEQHDAAMESAPEGTAALPTDTTTTVDPPSTSDNNAQNETLAQNETIEQNESAEAEETKTSMQVSETEVVQGDAEAVENDSGSPSTKEAIEKRKQDQVETCEAQEQENKRSKDDS
jgi:hypothetical protein